MYPLRRPGPPLIFELLQQAFAEQRSMREREKVICALDDLERCIWKKLRENFRNASRWDAARIPGPQADGKRKRAERVQAKAARVHFDWPDARSAWAKVEEEIREATAALASGEAARVHEELGDVLFSLVNVARLSAIDAEGALQDAIEKFRRRFAAMEADLIAQGKSVGAVPQDEMERSWESAKAHERSRAKP